MRRQKCTWIGWVRVKSGLAAVLGGRGFGLRGCCSNGHMDLKWCHMPCDEGGGWCRCVDQLLFITRRAVVVAWRVFYCIAPAMEPISCFDFVITSGRLDRSVGGVGFVLGGAGFCAIWVAVLLFFSDGRATTWLLCGCSGGGSVLNL